MRSRHNRLSLDIMLEGNGQKRCWTVLPVLFIELMREVRLYALSIEHPIIRSHVERS